MQRRKKPATLKPMAAFEALRKNPALGPWVEVIGRPRLARSRESHFAFLLRSIVYQQLAGQAAATIHGRVLDALGGEPAPRPLSRLSDEALRAAGLSRAKLAAIRDLSDKASKLQLDDLEWQDDEEVVQRLTTVRGIGPWTAHMFLMFALRRPDVWPIGDLGVRAGYAKVHGLSETPTEKQSRPWGDAYRPWCSAAAWYFWRVLETDLPA